ncbi:type II toxin-antitoxin system HicB family antitoxin [Sulfurimonas microaerophilic]|uniref:type II toxin-antitoxin system HicB family antitoxin n=1 Tax=Sulfurimonas microaerophilic TaxID=3058392 RepID=UPI002714A36D|nr:type II toxin-antitoxin system HicB family antitoxin [Sulfurimonas sp. hsl 1-7]
MKYVAFVFQDEDEFTAVVPDISGCIASDDTEEEACEAILDAVELCLEDEKLPTANTLEYFTDEVLNKLGLPLNASRYVVDVEDEGENSYSAKISS